MDLSFSDVLIFGLPLLLVVWGIVHEASHRRMRTSRRVRRTCADAAEGAGLKLEPDTYCDDAFDILHALGAYALPVIVGKHFLGFFTSTSAMKCGGRDLSSTYVGAVMTEASECRSVRADTDLNDARRQLRSSPYAMLPVLDREKQLVGFVTEESISRTLSPAASESPSFLVR